MSDLSWAQSHTPCNRCVRFATTVASGRATLATKRTLLLTWAGLPPAGSHQLAAGALILSPRRIGQISRDIDAERSRRDRFAEPHIGYFSEISAAQCEVFHIRRFHLDGSSC